MIRVLPAGLPGALFAGRVQRTVGDALRTDDHTVCRGGYDQPDQL
jgi:hypothetical protein